MKKSLTLITLIILATSVFASVDFTLQPDSSSVTPGSTLNVDVNLANTEAIHGYEFNINEVLNFQTYTPTSRIDGSFNNGGQISSGAFRAVAAFAPGPGLGAGSGSIFRITYNVPQSATGTINLNPYNFHAYNAQGQEIAANIQGASVSVDTGGGEGNGEGSGEGNGGDSGDNGGGDGGVAEFSGLHVEHVSGMQGETKTVRVCLENDVAIGGLSFILLDDSRVTFQSAQAVGRAAGGFMDHAPAGDGRAVALVKQIPAGGNCDTPQAFAQNTILELTYNLEQTGVTPLVLNSVELSDTNGNLLYLPSQMQNSNGEIETMSNGGGDNGGDNGGDGGSSGIAGLSVEDVVGLQGETKTVGVCLENDIGIGGLSFILTDDSRVTFQTVQAVGRGAGGFMDHAPAGDGRAVALVKQIPAGGNCDTPQAFAQNTILELTYLLEEPGITPLDLSSVELSDSNGQLLWSPQSTHISSGSITTTSSGGGGGGYAGTNTIDQLDGTTTVGQVFNTFACLDNEDDPIGGFAYFLTFPQDKLSLLSIMPVGPALAGTVATSPLDTVPVGIGLLQVNIPTSGGTCTDVYKFTWQALAEGVAPLTIIETDASNPDSVTVPLEKDDGVITITSNGVHDLFLFCAEEGDSTDTIITGKRGQTITIGNWMHHSNGFDVGGINEVINGPGANVGLFTGASSAVGGAFDSDTNNGPPQPDQHNGLVGVSLSSGPDRLIIRKTFQIDPSAPLGSHPVTFGPVEISDTGANLKDNGPNLGCTIEVVECAVDADCNDGDPCTTDSCSNTACSNVAIPNCPSTPPSNGGGGNTGGGGGGRYIEVQYPVEEICAECAKPVNGKIYKCCGGINPSSNCFNPIIYSNCYEVSTGAEGGTGGGGSASANAYPPAFVETPTTPSETVTAGTPTAAQPTVGGATARSQRAPQPKTATKAGESSSESITGWVIGLLVLALLGVGAFVITRKKKPAAPTEPGFAGPEMSESIQPEVETEEVAYEEPEELDEVEIPKVAPIVIPKPVQRPAAPVSANRENYAAAIRRRLAERRSAPVKRKSAPTRKVKRKAVRKASKRPTKRKAKRRR